MTAQASAARGPGRLEQLGRFAHRAAELLDRARFVFVPLGMAALLAVGAHAAADVLGDIFLELLGRLQGALGALASRWEFTTPLVELIGLGTRTLLGRSLALGFELAADLALAVPMLGFDESPRLLARAQALLLRSAKRPALLTATRALFAAALGLAGACAVARLLHGALALQLHVLPAHGLGLPRALALIALVWIIAALVTRCTLRALEHAEQRLARKPLSARRRTLVGLWSAAILAPLGGAAVLRAIPFESFLR